MSITATELKLNLSKYLLLSATEDIYITKNGKVISKLTNPFQERVDIANHCLAYFLLIFLWKKREMKGWIRYESLD